MTGQQLEPLIETLVENLELEISSEQKNKLLKFTVLLMDGLQKQRLLGDKTAEAIIGKHYYDSLYLLKCEYFSPESSVLDMGSGGGFPGIPLKICREDIILYLMDSNRKKTSFLEGAVRSLALERSYVLWGRAEDWGQRAGCREKYDIVLSRAVVEMASLAELVLPLVRLGGRAYLYKGPKGAKEAAEAKKAISTCGGKLERVWTYRLPTGEPREIYCLVKTEITPPQYPRKAGKPARKPLK